jgi:hypothetical protein
LIGVVVLAPLLGLGLAATTAAGFDVGVASTMRIGSSAALLVEVVRPLAVVGDNVIEPPRAAGDAVISLRIEPPSELLAGFVGGVTIGGSVLPVAPDHVVLDSVAPAAGG